MASCLRCGKFIKKNSGSLCSRCAVLPWPQAAYKAGLNYPWVTSYPYATNWPDYFNKYNLCELCGTELHDTAEHWGRRSKYIESILSLEPETICVDDYALLIKTDYSWVDAAIEHEENMARYNKSSYNRAYKSYDAPAQQVVSAQWVPQVNSYKIHFPHYNETLVALIKSKVPANERSYDPSDNHAWYISEEYFDALLPIIRLLFKYATFNIVDKATVDQYNKGVAHQVVVSPDKLAEEFFQLAEKAGLQPERTSREIAKMKRIYLRSATYYHPDFHPERANEMSRLNEIWSVLTQSSNGDSYFK